MPEIPFIRSAHDRGLGLPGSRLVNMLAETNADAPLKNTLIPRPAMTSSYTVGAGPIRGTYSAPDVFSGAKFAVSGTTLYKDSSSLGTISGTDMVRFAASATQLAVVANGFVYVYDGTTLAQVTDVDVPLAIDVAFLAGRFLYAKRSSGRFYWSAVNDATDIDGLDFANAEGHPDNLVGFLVVGDTLFMFGGASTELWYASSNADDPYQKGQGRSYTKGCASRDTIQLVDNAAFFVSDDRVVYRGAAVPERISDHGVESALRACTSISTATAVSFTFEGHAIYLLNIPGQGSFGYDVSSERWATWESYGKTVFRGRAAMAVSGTIYLGDDTTSTIWTLTRGSYVDGTETITRIASAFIGVTDGRPRCERITLVAARGVGLSGPANANRFTGPSDFSDPAWVDISTGTTTVTANNVAAPDSTVTADRLVGNNTNTWWAQDLGAGWAGKTITVTVWLYATVGYTATLYLSLNGGATYSQSAVLTTAWQQFTFTQALAGADTQPLRFAINHGNAHTTYAWKAEAYDVTTPTGGYNPTVEERHSDDMGRTWSRWRSGTLGAIGRYEKAATWRIGDRMREPGRLLEFRVTDPVNFALASVLVNAPRS